MMKTSVRLAGGYIFMLLFSGFALVILGDSRANAQNIPVIKFTELERMMKSKTDTTYVFNFWATWCKPCIKELPYFENITSTHSEKKVKVVLVSLDFKRQYETRLLPFVAERKISSTVVLLDDQDYNKWIDKVDPSWQGSIPATLFVNNSSGKRKFYEKEFEEEELNRELLRFIGESENPGSYRERK